MKVSEVTDIDEAWDAVKVLSQQNTDTVCFSVHCGGGGGGWSHLHGGGQTASRFSQQFRGEFVIRTPRCVGGA